MAEAEAERPVDGRTLRALRTRDAIVEACSGLIDEGDLRPTAPRIAQRAQVSVRSIFQHFDDLEGLHAAVSDRYLERVGSLTFDIDPCLALRDRVALAVDQRRRVLEAIGPTRRAATVHAPFSEAVKIRLHLAHQVARDDVERVFRAEADGLAPAEARLFFDSLSTALSWMVWDNLRTFVGRDAEGAAEVVTQLVWGVLRQWAAGPPD